MPPEETYLYPLGLLFASSYHLTAQTLKCWIPATSLGLGICIWIDVAQATRVQQELKLLLSGV